jgi:hypothetical protein
MFWVREITGWALIVLGLAAFYVVYFVFLRSSPARVFESGPMVLIGIFLFRGGIHLLKVAVAARICQQTPEPKRRPVASARLR